MRRVKFKVVRIYNGRRCSIFAEGSYHLEYPKGVIVRAREETCGVAVFRTKKQAEAFRDNYLNLTIIHVRPVGRGRNVRSICTDPSENQLDAFYRERRQNVVSESDVPPGTIFYPAVRVLD